MKIIIAGGGTGGHVFPALAIADAWRRYDSSVGILFAGTKRGLEATLVPKKGYKVEFIETPSLKGKGLGKILLALLKMPYALWQSYKLLKQYQPGMVIGVGGYASGPVCLVAVLIGIRTVVAEQNSYPGVANRILGWFVEKIFISFEESEKYFPIKKVVFSGNPVRESLKFVMPLHIDDSKIYILCFGGSQGAATINRGVIEALGYLGDLKSRLHFIHQVGRGANLREYEAAYKNAGVEAEVSEFIYDMEKRYSEATLVICRAGATTLAELAMSGRPAILIPYPFAADDHQMKNARAVEKAGGAIVIKNSDVTGKLLAEKIKWLLDGSDRLLNMSTLMKKMARPDAADVIVKESLGLFGDVDA